MPKKNTLNRIVHQSPYSKTTFVDTPRKFKEFTKVVTVEQAPVAVKQLRSREITVFAVQREPEDPDTLVSSGPVGIKFYEHILSGSGARELCQTPGGRQWLEKSRIGHVYLALPEELRTSEVAEEHYKYLSETKITETLGFEAEDYIYTWRLRSTVVGRKYLYFVENCPRLQALLPNKRDLLERTVVGRIFLRQHSIKTNQSHLPTIFGRTDTDSEPLDIVKREPGLLFTPDI